MSKKPQNVAVSLAAKLKTVANSNSGSLHPLSMNHFFLLIAMYNNMLSMFLSGIILYSVQYSHMFSMFLSGIIPYSVQCTV